MLFIWFDQKKKKNGVTCYSTAHGNILMHGCCIPTDQVMELFSKPLDITFWYYAAGSLTDC